MYRAFRFAIVVVAAATFAHPDAAGGATADDNFPPAIGTARAFFGRVEYSGRRIDRGVASPVVGVLTVSPTGWSLEERGAGFVLRAGGGGATISSGSKTYTLDDALEADGLVNAWAVAFGRLAVGSWTANGSTATLWSDDTGLRAYLTAGETRLLGVYDRRAPLHESFIFDDWTESAGIAMPQRILRLRNGATSAGFSIDHYVVSRVGSAPASLSAPGAPVALVPSGAGPARAGATKPESANRDATAVVADFFTLFGLLLIGGCLVAWFRREALTERICRHLAADPRAFRHEGTSVFVSPEGVLYFDGSSYRVGSLYYGRAARVQLSPLFLRVTAKGVSRAVVVPRKFKPFVRRGSSVAFSLIEATMATAVFAVVVVGCVFPTLIAISRADAFAAKRAAATRIAANALTDEELACAYGSTIDVGTTTTAVDGMQVTVTVVAAQTSGADDISVSVSDSTQILARVATVVGPPVPTPAPQPGGA